MSATQLIYIPFDTLTKQYASPIIETTLMGIEKANILAKSNGPTCNGILEINPRTVVHFAYFYVPKEEVWKTEEFLPEVYGKEGSEFVRSLINSASLFLG